jgi:MoxR-like ATPase
MNPAELSAFLTTLVRNQVKLSTMIWGPPGIGKSSIVAQTAAAHDLGCIDLRLSQLAPTDLRGLPVAHDGRARWYPPEFLPGEGAGILFLDEINLAPPTMQGMAQQLVLDRRVGSYVVPEGWFIWAAGNRQEDSAAVFEMPAPVANRFLHVDVAPDLESFKAYALQHGIHEQIIAFLTFRPTLLHRFDPAQPAWPSPRSWAMASELHRLGLDVRAAIGPATAAGSAGGASRRRMSSSRHSTSSSWPLVCCRLPSRWWSAYMTGVARRRGASSVCKTIRSCSVIRRSISRC